MDNNIKLKAHQPFTPAQFEERANLLRLLLDKRTAPAIRVARGFLHRPPGDCRPGAGMTRRANLLALALAVGPLTACEWPVPALPVAPPATPAARTRPAQTIYVGEDYDVEFDARPGDYVIVIMFQDDSDGEGWVGRCNNMGGEPIFNPYTLIAECDGVDF